MTDTAQILAIAGAAEGSWYTVGGVTDLRYKPSFANSNSGMSFGTFQFDVATNTDAQRGLKNILSQAVGAKLVDQATSDRIYAGASMRNAKVHLKPDDLKAVTTQLAGAYAKGIIDTLDLNRAATVGPWIDGMIAEAAATWAAKKVAAAPILTPGKPDCLTLFAYLLASLNRYPANEDTCQTWLNGGKVTTANGPAGGTQLKAPPTLDQMHAFFQSLKIWDGTQGDYSNLRARLDPTLAAL